MQTFVFSLEEFSRDLLDQLNDAVILLDKEMRILYHNAGAVRLFELQTDSVRGKKLSELRVFKYPGQSREDILHSIVVNGQWRGELSFLNEEGAIVHILCSVNEYHHKGTHVGYIGVVKDISPLKQGASLLEKTMAHHKQMLNSITEGVILHDKDGRVLDCNRSAEEKLGMNREKIAGFLFPETDFTVLLENMQAVPFNKHPVYKAFFTRKSSKNQLLGLPFEQKIKWLSININPVFDPENGNPVAAVSSFRDVTREQELKQRLKHSERLFEAFMNNTPSLNWITAEDGTILFFNKKYLRDFKFSPGTIGKNIYEIFPTEAASEFARNNKEVLKQNRTIIAVEKIPYTGKIRSFLVMKFPLQMPDGIRAVGGTGMDITEQLEMEESIRNQEISLQKSITRASIEAQEKERAEIGKQLHESVNQLLSSSKMMLQLAVSQDAADTPILLKSEAFLTQAIREINLLSVALTPQMLMDIGLTESIRAMAEPIAESGKLNIQLFLDPEVNLLPYTDIKLTVLRIIQEQLNNILRHAEANYCSIVLELKTGYLSLQISDNGIGFDLTGSKKSGLHHIRYRVDSYRGNFTLETSPGNGCQLKVSLPLA